VGEEYGGPLSLRREALSLLVALAGGKELFDDRFLRVIPPGSLSSSRFNFAGPIGGDLMSELGPEVGLE